ncbi:MAG: HAMP domain-containing sensor histidine kinase [Pseudorhodoplanes sp.]|jgi:signal transduction histidine kinase|nr:HAMP domain-containing sensor histidine kinase [Pseudorhodoplanes sp.]
MSWGSLRLRLVAGGIAAILLALTIAGAGLTLLFERHVTRTLADDLDVHLKQLLAGIDVNANEQLEITRPPVDPRFANPLSGLYWQVSDERGDMLRSRSLWDTTMALPLDDPGPGEVHHHETAGPGGSRMLVAERVIKLVISGREVRVRVAVAADLARISTAAAAFAKDLIVALAVLGVVLAAATSIQVGLGLRPLDLLRRGIADIRAGRSRHLPAAVPAEVRPLVEEVNALLDAQEREMESSRSRAADLAHGLKTPLAALVTDAARLHARGEHAIAEDIEAVGDAMSRHVDRELARARVSIGLRRGLREVTELAPLVRSLAETLARTPAGMRIAFELQIPEDMRVPFERTDLAEVLGNVLENAARHAATRVRIAANMDQDNPSITIEDDGEGIAPALLPRVLERGVRLDQRGKGAGLGLAIVQDVLDAYGWRLDLTRSELGGLKATITRKAAPGPRAATSTAPVPASLTGT